MTVRWLVAITVDDGVEPAAATLLDDFVDSYEAARAWVALNLPKATLPDWGKRLEAAVTPGDYEPVTHGGVASFDFEPDLTRQELADLDDEGHVHWWSEG